MRAMKNGKAMREDGIPVELVKVAGQTAMTELLDLFNTALRREEVPEGWQHGFICPIYKKGERTLCSNHRGEMLLSHIGKISIE